LVSADPIPNNTICIAFNEYFREFLVHTNVTPIQAFGISFNEFLGEWLLVAFGGDKIKFLCHVFIIPNGSEGEKI
jgi:hypothetical protein